MVSEKRPDIFYTGPTLYTPTSGASNGPYPQYSCDFPEDIPEKFRKDPGNALRAFPGISLESTAGMPQTLSFKAFEASRASPEFSPPQYGWGHLVFFSELVPERASQSWSWNSQQYWGGGISEIKHAMIFFRHKELWGP